MNTKAKSLGDLGAVLGAAQAAKEDALLALLQRYGASATPAYSAIANELGILEEGVRILLAKLERKGKIHFISRNPPRIMLVCAEAAAVAEPSGEALPGAYGRFLDAEGQRMRLARFIGDFEGRMKRGPSLREMMDFSGFTNAGYVARMAEILTERGLVQFGHGVPTRLTELGRQQFGFKRSEPVEEKKTVIVVPVAKARRSHDQTGKARRLCEILADHIRADPERGAYTHYRVIATAMGYRGHSSGLISKIAQLAVVKGWLKPKPHKTHGLFFTDKGRAKFMPETLPAPEAAEPEISFTERVPKDSPLGMETPVVAQVANAIGRNYAPIGGLDFDLNSQRLRVTGSTKSRAELAAFIGKLGALMPFLGE